MGDVMKNDVREWLGISEEEFDKIKGRGKCVKCGKETSPTDNLCVGHKRAYHRWQRNQEVIENIGTGFIIHTSKMETNRGYFFKFQHRQFKATRWEDGNIEVSEA
jgi:hypothetical protein